MERVAKVRQERLNSKKDRTKQWADQPFLFSENRQTESNYLAVPKVSSERRPYLPIGYLKPEQIATGSLQVIPFAELYHFGILSSIMHMAWMRQICGRMKSDYQYSNSIVYNNFPWPDNPSAKQRQAVEDKAQAVLDARAQFPDSSLADLYDPLTMPPALLKAHHALDKAADAAYGKTDFAAEAERVAFLFDLYQKYTASLLPAASKKKKGRRRKGNS
jgi:hypothetical protein